MVAGDKCCLLLRNGKSILDAEFRRWEGDYAFVAYPGYRGAMVEIKVRKDELYPADGESEVYGEFGSLYSQVSKGHVMVSTDGGGQNECGSAKLNLEQVDQLIANLMVAREILYRG